MEKDHKKTDILELKIPIKRVYPEDLNSYFVTNMTIQHQPDHFILQFFEVFPPLILGSDEEKKSLVESLDNIEAKCVGRIIVTPEKFSEFLETMNDNYKKYLNKFDNHIENHDNQ